MLKVRRQIGRVCWLTSPWCFWNWAWKSPLLITTLGERVEDVLWLQADGEHIRDAQQCYNIEQAIRQRLDQTLKPTE